MNVKNKKLQQTSYAQLYNNSLTKTQTPQNVFSLEKFEGKETIARNDHDQDDTTQNNVLKQSEQALRQFFYKQKNNIFPTTPQVKYQYQQYIQSVLQKNLESFYASSTNSYTDTNIPRSLNVKA